MEIDRSIENKPIAFGDIIEWDEIKITGCILSEPGRPRVVDLIGTVGTVYDIDRHGEDGIKVWPKDDNHPGLPPDHNGKLWFDSKSTEFVMLIERDWDLYI